MIAGLPKLSPVVFCLSILLVFAAGVAAQETQTGSIVPDEIIQSGSFVPDEIIQLIDENPLLDEVQRTELLDSLETAMGSVPDLLTPEAVAGLLEELEWGTLEDLDDVAEALTALELLLAGASSGEITDLEEALENLLDNAETPEGILNALGNAAAGLADEETEELLSQAEDLIESGLPPGIVLRVAKEGLRDGLSPEEIAAMLEALEEGYNEGESPGLAANAATGKGKNRHREEEENANEDDDEEEPGQEEEREANQNDDGDEEDPDEPEEEPEDEPEDAPGNSAGKGKGKKKD